MKGEMRLLYTKYCMICAWQLPVQVVHTDGHIRSLARPVTVAELLKRHPHHFVCEPASAGPLFHTAMLPSEMELEEGRVYLLLPLPRLLPHLSGSTLPCCSCFQDTPTPDPHGNNRDFKRWFVRNQGHLLDTLKVAKVVRSVVRMSRRVLPERVRMRLSFHKLHCSNFTSKASDAKPNSSLQVQMCTTSRNRWRPALQRISEVDLLTTSASDSDVVTHQMTTL